MRRNDRCPGLPGSAPRTTIWQKIKKGGTRLLGASCAVRRYFAGRVVRHLILGAGLAFAFWTFWAFSVLGQAHAATISSHKPTLTSVRAAMAGAPAHGRRHALRPAHHRVRRRTPHHTTPRLLGQARRAVIQTIEGRPHLQSPPSGGPTMTGRPADGLTGRLGDRLTGRLADWLGGRLGGRLRHPYQTLPAHRTDQGGDPSCPRETSQTRTPADRTAESPSASRRGTSPRGPPEYSGTAVPGHVPLGVIHAVKPRKPRTAPVTPVSTPVSAPSSGSSESDGFQGNTSSGAGDDLPWLRLPTPGHWCVAPQQATRIGRYIADKPSFSPD